MNVLWEGKDVIANELLEFNQSHFNKPYIYFKLQNIIQDY